MTTFNSDQITNSKYYPGAAPHSAREVHQVDGIVSLPDTLAANDLAKLVELPAHCIPVDCVLISDDLDTNATPTIVFDVGILNAAGTDLVPSSDLISASIIGQTGGTERMNSKECSFAPATWLAEATSPKIYAKKTVALKVTTVAATKAAGYVYFRLYYRAAELGK